MQHSVGGDVDSTHNYSLSVGYFWRVAGYSKEELWRICVNADSCSREIIKNGVFFITQGSLLNSQTFFMYFSD